MPKVKETPIGSPAPTGLVHPGLSTRTRRARITFDRNGPVRYTAGVLRYRDQTEGCALLCGEKPYRG